MGLHRRRPRPMQPPVPDITIVLNGRLKQVYRPGDQVKGQVLVRPVQCMKPDNILVELLGRSTVNFVTNTQHGPHIWVDKAPLLRVSDEVTAKVLSTPLEPGHTYNFPFKFRFPTTTHNNRDSYKKPNDQRWLTEAHALPPTFWDSAWSCDNRFQSNGANFARIDYGLKVTLSCPGTGVVKGKELLNVTASMPILFAASDLPTSTPAMFLRHPTGFSIRMSALSKNTFRINRHTNIRGASSSRSTQIELLIEMPDVVKAGSDFKFMVSSKILHKSSHLTHMPTIEITGLNLLLRSHTLWRASPLDNRYEVPRCHLAITDRLDAPNSMSFTETTKANSSRKIRRNR